MQIRNLLHHPLHPAFVHFPIACWSLATLGDLIGMFVDEKVWLLANILLIIGTIGAIFAMLTGLLEISKVDQGGPAARVFERHIQLVLLTWCIYATSLFLRFEGNEFVRPNSLEIGISVLGFLVLCVAAWYGAALVYEYKTGVKD